MMLIRSSDNMLERKRRCIGAHSKLAANTVSVSEAPKTYGWIEFPVWVMKIGELAKLLECVFRQVKDCERLESTIRLFDNLPNGRFTELESAFEKWLVPYDCGGEGLYDRIPWNGWWRIGCRHPVHYEVSSTEEQFIVLDDLRDLLRKHEENSPLYAALSKLVKKNDSSPPVPLRHTGPSHSTTCPATTRPRALRWTLTDLIRASRKMLGSLRTKTLHSDRQLYMKR